MNSSTFTSKLVTWRRVLCRYGVWCAIAGLVSAALLVLSDPYDTGRLTPFASFQVSAFDQRMAMAGLGRLPEATGAIMGNSTIQLVDPAELRATTGIDFVSLTIPGGWPIEHLAVARYFARQHAPGSGHEAQALVFGLDKSWCRDDGRLEPLHPFPFWLIGKSNLAYVAGLMQLESFGALGRKLEEWAGWLKPPRRDGYHDYDFGQPNKLGQAYGNIADYSYPPPTGKADFAAVAHLKAFLDDLPATVTVVLIFVPRHYTSFAAPESLEGRTETLCKQAFRDLAARRAKTVVVDLLQDDAMARNDDNFLDQIHYRHSVAHVVAASIASALAQEARVR
jgi:hypothetical protein